MAADRMQYRKVGDRVEIRGTVRREADLRSVTLPEGYRPQREIHLVVDTARGPGIANVFPDGSMTAPRGVGWIRFGTKAAFVVGGPTPPAP